MSQSGQCPAKRRPSFLLLPAGVFTSFGLTIATCFLQWKHWARGITFSVDFTLGFELFFAVSGELFFFRNLEKSPTRPRDHCCELVLVRLLLAFFLLVEEFVNNASSLERLGQ